MLLVKIDWPRPVNRTRIKRRSRALAQPSAPPVGYHPMYDDERPPICQRCGVTMVPAALSADETTGGDWVCLECEELDDEES